MTPTPQLTPYTCALACLESYFSDINQPHSQCEMLKNHYRLLENPDPERRHEYGAATDAQIIGLCTHLGFVAGLYQDFRQPEVEKAFTGALATNAGVLIPAFWKRTTHHCVRLTQVKSPGLYEVMCPLFHHDAQFEDVTFPNLVSWGFRFIIITQSGSL